MISEETRMGDKGLKRSEENEMRGTESCCGEDTTTTSTEILKPGRFISFWAYHRHTQVGMSGVSVRQDNAGRMCGKTNDAVVPQRLGGRNWKTVRQSSLSPSHSHFLSEQWAGEKSKYSLSRSVSL
jgi:hypothetical protein